MEFVEMSDSNPNDRYDSRLDRIEQKIDKLSEAMVSIARAEERIVAIEQDRQDYWNRLNHHSEKLDTLEKRTNVVENETQILDRVFEQDRKNCSESLRIQGERIGEMEVRLSEAARTTSIINKMFWIFATGTIAFIGTEIFNLV